MKIVPQYGPLETCVRAEEHGTEDIRLMLQKAEVNTYKRIAVAEVQCHNTMTNNARL